MRSPISGAQPPFLHNMLPFASKSKLELGPGWMGLGLSCPINQRNALVGLLTRLTAHSCLRSPRFCSPSTPPKSSASVTALRSDSSCRRPCMPRVGSKLLSRATSHRSVRPPRFCMAETLHAGGINDAQARVLYTALHEPVAANAAGSHHLCHHSTLPLDPQPVAAPMGDVISCGSHWCGRAVLPGSNEPGGAKDMVNISAFLNWAGPSGDFPLRPPMLKHARIIVAPDGTDCFTDAASAAQVALTTLCITLLATISLMRKT